jgi:membrane protease YdiL (CAAX protease family)
MVTMAEKRQSTETLTMAGHVDAGTRGNSLVAPLMSLWRRLPVVVRALVTGLVLLVAGTLPWASLVALNIKYGSAVPWAVAPAALYLWLYWRFVRGAGWPRSTAEVRRTLARANRLSPEVWGIALMAGVVGLAAVMLLQQVMTRLVTLPQQRAIDPSRFPFATVLLWVLMGSIVAGVVEETSFRGYMQLPIERRHGPLVAILLTGTLFGFMHFTHPEVGLVLMPFYLAVAAVYGALAYITNSIFPSMILHAGGNMLVALALFAGGRSEWQASPGPTRLIWETGPDASFWIALIAFLIVGVAAVGAYAFLARVARDAR